MGVKKTLAAEFLEFVVRAQRMVGDENRLSPDAEVFRKFIGEATPMLVSNIRLSLYKIVALAKLAKRWLVRHDLLYDAGLTYEDSYTNLMAWALHPDTHPASERGRQQAWLASLGLNKEFSVRKPCVPKLWLSTDDGIPDLVLQYQNGVIVVEAKTKSGEHPAPSGGKQTDVYPEAVRRKLQLGENSCVKLVFITRDRKQPSNPEAKSTTFVEFALTLVEVLDRENLHPDTKAAYAMFFTHFLTHAAPYGTDVRKLVDEIVEWSEQSAWSQKSQIPGRLELLLMAAEIFRPEGIR